jgi:RNA polymerase sigma-70 factor (family 1)
MEGNKFDSEIFLIKSLRNGSEEAFTYFFIRYHNELCNYLTAISHDSILAEELAQQAFIKIWDKKLKLQIKENSLKKYFFKMAYNLFIDTKRHEKKKHKLLESLKQEAYLDVLNYNNETFEITLKMIETMIENLPKQCKKVFIMGKKDGLKYHEISLKLHISIKTVEAHMSKALKKLRAQLIVIPNESN